jgi:hypothetical protein
MERVWLNVWTKVLTSGIFVLMVFMLERLVEISDCMFVSLFWG